MAMAGTPLTYVSYRDESQLPLITTLMEADLSEPYSVFTYRYFLNNWPNLCILAMDGEECVGSIVCKLDDHGGAKRGYIAMLAVRKDQRKRGIGSELVKRAIERMREDGGTEVVLETEVSNKGAIALYEALGFIKEKRMHRYYLNGGDAFRLKLWLYD